LHFLVAKLSNNDRKIWQKFLHSVNNNNTGDDDDDDYVDNNNVVVVVLLSLISRPAALC